MSVSDMVDEGGRTVNHHFINTCNTVAQKTVPMFGHFVMFEL